MRAAARAHTIWWAPTSRFGPPATRLPPIVWKGSSDADLHFQVENEEGFAGLRGRPRGQQTPQHHGPWTVTGAIGLDNAPPHNFSRDAIEEAIDTEGFQLWRLSKKTEAPV